MPSKKAAKQYEAASWTVSEVQCLQHTFSLSFCLSLKRQNLKVRDQTLIPIWNI